ncbi:MAG: PD40 domain-containing protein [Myxococcales bacterium]|nr:PD40 domain-containing protein [Myxococcales bacterium]
MTTPTRLLAALTLTLLTLLTLLAPRAHAGDGDLEWLTVETRHFRVHYPRGLEAVAHRAARLCEEAHDVIGELYGYTPAVRVEVSVIDYGDSANGSATALPYPRMTFLAAPPSLEGNLNDYDSWLRLLVIHEYVHIVQLDRIRGLPWLFNAILGRVMAPNQALPSFVLEGGAVWGESVTSGRGRVRSATFRGILRAQALAERLHPIDAMTHYPLTWPGANVWYMYGGHLFDWIARTYGRDVPARLHDAIADDLIPFGLNRAMVEASGHTMTEAVARWQAELTATARAEAEALRAQGTSDLHPVTLGGRHRANLVYLPDGELWSVDGGDREFGIYARSPALLRGPPNAEPRVVMQPDNVPNFHVCRGGAALVYDRGDTWRGAYSRYDLYHYDFTTGTERRLTHGARVREPGCSPDGRWAAAVQIIAGRTRLVRVDFADGAITVLHDPGELDQVGFPRVSPDGREVITTRVSRAHGRSLIAVDVATGAIRTLGPTADPALELHPSFSLDGRWLLYASDRTGVWDIYAHRWPDGPTHRASRVITGALSPALAPDGRTLAVQLIGTEGYDIATLPFDEANLLPLPEAIDPAIPPRPDASAAPLPLAPRPYAPHETLWPVGWSPTFSFSTATESATTLGLELSGNDPLGHHAYVAVVQTTPETDNLALALDYAWRRRVATLGLSLGHQTQARPFDNLYGDYRERITSGSAGVSFPLSSQGHGASFSARYGLSHRAPAENADRRYDPLDPGPRYTARATRDGSLSFGVGYSNLDSLHYDAISLEQGRTASLTVRLRHPILASDFTTAEVFGGYQEYIPLWARHVLALKLNGAFGRGDRGRSAFYALSAPPERSWFLDALDRIAYGTSYLRGYPTSTARGDRYLLAKLEYRLPLFDVYRGLATLPVFLQRMKLALYTDFAQASTEPLSWEPDAFLRSIGAELVTEATVGWKQGFSLRFGYAQGLDDAGEGQMYFFLGSWF